jgi:hypothetical protein
VVPAVAAFAVWTAVVWVGRIRNVVEADALSAAGRAWRLGLAVSFVVGAVVVAVRLWSWAGGRAGSPPAAPGSGLGRAVTALAVWTMAVWLVRGSAILAGPYDTGFKVVHTVLAVGSVVLAVAAWRAVGGRFPVMTAPR